MCYDEIKEENAVIQIVPTTQAEVTKIVCPTCKEKVQRVAIKKDSKIDGLTFKCRRCSSLWEIKTE